MQRAAIFFQIIYVDQIINVPIEKTEKSDNTTVPSFDHTVHCKDLIVKCKAILHQKELGEVTSQGLLDTNWRGYEHLIWQRLRTVE